MLKRAASAVMAQQKVVSAVKSASRSRLPPLDDFLSACDFAGAQTLLEFELRTGDSSVGSDAKGQEWLAYAAFHSGDYKLAAEIYTKLISESETDGKVTGDASVVAPAGLLHLYRAACLYHSGAFADAEAEAGKGLDTPLKRRILYHCAHKLGKESALVSGHGILSKSSEGEDSLCLAAMHVARGHYQEASDTYKKLLLEKEHKEDAALHFYIALCYYKMDYYDVSLEVLGSYMAALSPGGAGTGGPSASGMGSPQAGAASSIAGINLKACCAFKLFNGKAAEAELKSLTDVGMSIDSHDLLRHNMVCFKGGEGALRVLPGLVAQGNVPEARLNLAVYHLRTGNVDAAAEIVRGVSPSSPQEYLLVAVVQTLVAQRAPQGSPLAKEALRTAQQAFHLVGANPAEVDTIPGRQAMASHYHLTGQWEDECVYLSSIKPYLVSEEAFSWNYGIALAAAGHYKEGEEVLASLLHQGTNGGPAVCTGEPLWSLWLARCLIMNKKAGQAWELYLRSDGPGGTGMGRGVTHLLHLIAADCYRTSAFMVSAKAYDVLERMDGQGGDEELWQGKRGAVAGAFAAMVAGKEGKDRDTVQELLAMLRHTSEAVGQGHPAAAQAGRLAQSIGRWAQANGCM